MSNVQGISICLTSFGNNIKAEIEVFHKYKKNNPVGSEKWHYEIYDGITRHDPLLEPFSDSLGRQNIYSWDRAI